MPTIFGAPHLDEIVSVFRNNPVDIYRWRKEHSESLTDTEHQLCNELDVSWRFSHGFTNDREKAIENAMSRVGLGQYYPSYCQPSKLYQCPHPRAEAYRNYTPPLEHQHQEPEPEPKPIKPPEPASRFRMLELD